MIFFALLVMKTCLIVIKMNENEKKTFFMRFIHTEIYFHDS